MNEHTVRQEQPEDYASVFSAMAEAFETEAFMALELVPGALDGVSGTVRYPPEFDEV